jgi:hypothetical protein
MSSTSIDFAEQKPMQQERQIEQADEKMVDDTTERNNNNSNSEAPQPASASTQETATNEITEDVDSYKRYIARLETQLISLHTQVLVSIQSLRQDPVSTLCKKKEGETEDGQQSILQQLIDHYDKNVIASTFQPRHDRRQSGMRNRYDNYDGDTRRRKPGRRAYSSASESSDASDDSKKSRRSKRLSKQSIIIDESEGDTEITDVFDMVRVIIIIVVNLYLYRNFGKAKWIVFY